MTFQDQYFQWQLWIPINNIFFIFIWIFFVRFNAIYRGNKTLAQNRCLLFSCKFGQTVCQNCSAFHYCEIFIAQWWWYTVTWRWYAIIMTLAKLSQSIHIIDNMCRCLVEIIKKKYVRNICIENNAWNRRYPFTVVCLQLYIGLSWKIYNFRLFFQLYYVETHNNLRTIVAIQL